MLVSSISCSSLFMGEVVEFTDPNLKYEIKKELGLERDTIYEKDLLNLTTLYSNSKNISSIKGLEYCKNLKYLYLESNNISDIEALRHIDDIIIINLKNNYISDITPLSNKRMLTDLNINNNNLNITKDTENRKTLVKLLNRFVNIFYLEGNLVVEEAEYKKLDESLSYNSTLEIKQNKDEVKLAIIPLLNDTENEDKNYLSLSIPNSIKISVTAGQNINTLPPTDFLNEKDIYSKKHELSEQIVQSAKNKGATLLLYGYYGEHTDSSDKMELKIIAHDLRENNDNGYLEYITMLDTDFFAVSDIIASHISEEFE